VPEGDATLPAGSSAVNEQDLNLNAKDAEIAEVV